MFGCICAGRQVQTNLQIVSETEFLFLLPSAQSINHIVVFLLPTTQLPPDYAATVYFKWPGKQEFQLLGGLAMEKQSAIFRLRGSNNSSSNSNTAAAADYAMDGTLPTMMMMTEDTTAQLGISVEPRVQAQQKLMSLPAHLSSLTDGNVAADALVPSGNGVPRQQLLPPAGTAAIGGTNPVTTLTLARRIMRNAFNYLGSFSSGPPGAETVPMKEFQSWWNKFERKLSVDASFLEREEDG